MALRCRTCLKLTLGEGALRLDDKEHGSDLTVAEKLRECVPQIAINFIPNALMCANCLSYMNAAYDFRVMCLYVEERVSSCISNLMMLDNVGSPLREMVHDGRNGLRPLDGKLPPLYNSVKEQLQEQEDDVDEVVVVAGDQANVQDSEPEDQQEVQLGDDMKMEDIKDVEIIEDFESDDEDELSRVDIINDINQLMDAALGNGQIAKKHELLPPANSSLKPNPLNVLVQSQNNGLASEATSSQSTNGFFPEEQDVVEDNENAVRVKKRKKMMPLVKNGLSLPKKFKIKQTKTTPAIVKPDNWEVKAEVSSPKPVDGGEKTIKFRKAKKRKASSSTDSEDTLTCNLCGKVAVSLRSLKIHWTRKHPNTNFCYEADETPKVINLGSKKSGAKLHKCPICGKMRVAIKRHLADVHYNCEFGCKTCDGYFPDEKAQAEHVVSCEGHIYPCDRCSMSFGTAASYNKHSFSHRSQFD